MSPAQAISGAPVVPLDSTQHWYDTATVRHSPRILLSAQHGNDELFPRTRQMLAEHPAVVALGPAAVSYILAQSMYRQMHEVALLETRLVIECCIKISNGQIMPDATDDDRLDALTVIVDEAYHAHVAMDFIDQAKKRTGIAQLPVPAGNPHLRALEEVRASLPEEFRADFELLAVCVAEHILIKDIVAARREEKVAPTFTHLMNDHVSDEGRHATFFADLARRCWARMPHSARQAIGGVLPGFIRDYTEGDASRGLDHAMLKGCGLSAASIDEIMGETGPVYQEIMEMHVEMTRAHLMKLLQRIGILDHAPTRAAFLKDGLLAA